MSIVEIIPMLIEDIQHVAYGQGVLGTSLIFIYFFAMVAIGVYRVAESSHEEH
jgi:hypothetical protein